MWYLNHTFPSTEANLACDEALLEACEAGELGEVLRFWEPTTCAVVLGLSNVAEREAHLEACRKGNIRVLRRCSGGGAVFQGPGCLNYALILEVECRPEIRTVTDTNRHLMQRHAQVLSTLLGCPVRVQGTTDLAVGGRKCSGNAQRRRRQCVLFHGTFLLSLDLESVERYLPLPSRMPPYREGRAHREFLVNLNIQAAQLREAWRTVWQASETLTKLPHRRVESLIANRYSKTAWNLGGTPS